MSDEVGFDPERIRALVAQGLDELAVSYLEDLSDRGSIRAMIAMADYLMDRGDTLGSLSWMERAENSIAESDLVSPLYLASAYERGLGGGERPEREQKALRLLERVGESGNLHVIHALMTNYLYGLNGAPKNHAAFIFWAKKAASLGSKAAEEVLREEARSGSPKKP